MIRKFGKSFWTQKQRLAEKIFNIQCSFINVQVSRNRTMKFVYLTLSAIRCGQIPQLRIEYYCNKSLQNNKSVRGRW